MSADFEAGRVIAGKYRLEALIGKGGMGEVWRAVHVLTGRPIALKLLDPHLADRSDVVERFLQEARAAVRLRHPNVVDVLDMGQGEAREIYQALELLEGENLSEHLSRLGPMSVERTLDVLVPIMGAVASAHQLGLVHRDLKPANVFLARDATGAEVPKLLDFGIAKDLARPQMALTAAGAVFGTPEYMAPEQADGKGGVGPESDVWAMGVLLYRSLAGETPFTGGDLVSLLFAIGKGEYTPLDVRVPSVPPWLAAAVHKAISVDRKQRFPDMRAFLAAVQAGIEATAGDATHISTRPVASILPRSSRRSPFKTGLAVALIGAGLAGLLLLGLGQADRLHPRPRAVALALDAGAEADGGDLVERSQAVESRGMAAAAQAQIERLAVRSATCDAEAFSGDVWVRAQGKRALADDLFARDRFVEARAAYDEVTSLLGGLVQRCKAEIEREPEAAGDAGHAEDAAPSAPDAAEPPPKPARPSDLAAANAHFDRARALRSEGKRAQAIAELGKAIEAAPEFVAAYNTRALVRQESGDYEGAIADFDRALAIDPRQPGLFSNRGNARLARGDTEGAIADLGRAIALEPTSAVFLENRAAAWLAKERPDAALQDAVRAIAVDAKSAGAWAKKADAERRLGNLRGALASYARAIQLAPERTVLLYERASLRAELGDHAGVVQDLDLVIAKKPADALAHLRRGLAHMALGANEKAARDLARFLTLDPTSEHRPAVEKHLARLRR